MMDAASCEWCGDPLQGRRDQRFCSRTCKRSARRDRRRREAQSNYLRDLTPVAEAREADRRFAAMIAADQATADARQAAEWTRYEARHGTEHPGRTQARIQRQAAEQTARAPKFTALRWPSAAGLNGTERPSTYGRPGRAGTTMTPT